MITLTELSFQWNKSDLAQTAKKWWNYLTDNFISDIVNRWNKSDLAETDKKW
jgi:hypothetical protein